MTASKDATSSRRQPTDERAPPPSADHAEPRGPASSRRGEVDPTERLKREALEKLNECHSGEIALVHAYDRGLRRATSADVSQRLLYLHGDHARRAELVGSRIGSLDATVLPHVDALATQATLENPDWDLLDERGTVAALEALEHRALRSHEEGLALEDPSTRDFFRDVLLPAQQRTHQLCRALQARVTQDADAGTSALQQCLREELSAVETYETVLAGVTHVGIHHTLQELLASHARRADRLREDLMRFGSHPAKSSGMWGAIAMTVQTAAGLLGMRAAFGALEAGEDRLLGLYTAGVGARDGHTRALLDGALLEQRRTLQLCRTLGAFVTAPS